MVPLALMFHHINNITVLPENGILEIKPLLREIDPLHLTIELVKTELLTTVLDLSSQTTVTLFFTIHILQKIARAKYHCYSSVAEVNQVVSKIVTLNCSFSFG